ncbi:MAG TPA: hypothetical protein VL860_06060 [Planctomycetota bacterium]|nr:hypothetical protein [Planctomycetota bacterium]
MARDPSVIPPASESGRFLPPEEPDDSVNDVEVLLSRAADGELTAEEEQLLKKYVAEDPSKLSGLRKAIKLSQELDEVLGDMDLAEGMHREKELPKLKPTAPTFELIPYLRWWSLAVTLIFWVGVGLFRFLNLIAGPSGQSIFPPYSERWPYMIADWALTLCGLACVFFAGRMAAIDGKVMARLTGGGFKVSRTECLIIQAVGVALAIGGCILWYMTLQPVQPW